MVHSEIRNITDIEVGDVVAFEVRCPAGWRRATVSRSLLACFGNRDGTTQTAAFSSHIDEIISAVGRKASTTPIVGTIKIEAIDFGM